MSAVITKDGENLIARCQAEGRVLKIDKMIIGNVPGVDPLADIDRDSQKPTAEQIVDELVIPDEYKAYVNPNQVVYSIVMDANRGNYDFNWIGLYSSEDDVVVAITILPTLAKYKTEGQIQGNHLTRNFMLEYFGAAQSTGMSVAAETWQLDHSARLGGMDERIRWIGRELFGVSVFRDDGWKLVKEGEDYKLLPGVGFVEGIKIELEAARPISSDGIPKSVWLDVYLEPQGSDVVAVAEPVSGHSFENYVRNGVAHFFVKIGMIDVDGSCIDFRRSESLGDSFLDYFKETQNILLKKAVTPRIEQPENVTPSAGALNVMDPATFVGNVGRSLYGLAIISATVFVYSDPEGKNLIHTKVVSCTNNCFSYTAPADTLTEGATGSWQFYYTDEEDNTSEMSELTAFSASDVFQFVETTRIISPSTNAEISANNVTMVIDAMQVEPNGNADHVASQYKITSDEAGLIEVYDSGEVADLLSHVLGATLERGHKFYAWARQKDRVRGWGGWSIGVAFFTINVGHGVRVDGGVAVGPILLADSTVAWLVAAPGNQRVAKPWGLHDIDTILDNFEGKTIDTRTGEENTNVLNSSTYANHVDDVGNVGSPAAKYCSELDYEGCTDFFFPNMPELNAVRKYKDLIDAADETGVNSVSSQLTTYGGFLSSTELDIDDVNIVRGHYLYPSYLATKANAEHLVLPCRKILIPTTVEKVDGGIKIGPMPFADGEFGYLIIPFASQRPFAKWGLKDSSLSQITNVGFALASDPNTGEYNTTVLTGDSCNSIVDAYGNTGCPAANACAGLDYEGVTGFSLPSADELKFILSVKDEIDAIDIAVSGSDANTFSNRSANYCWSSTSLNSTNAIAVRINDGDITGKDKDGSWYIVPCKRVITGA